MRVARVCGCVGMWPPRNGCVQCARWTLALGRVPLLVRWHLPYLVVDRDCVRHNVARRSQERGLAYYGKRYFRF